MNCTSSDTCRQDGSCLGTALSCDDNLSCTSDSCDENTVSCKATVLLGCAIDGACYADGAEDPDNSCRRCSPMISALGWTNKPAAASCSDGNTCTVDTCNGAGTCVSTARDCNDNLSCTTDSCDQNTGSCVSTASSSCVIDGQCLAGGADNPLNDCQTCDPQASKTSWSSKSVGASCTGGLYCTTGRTCNNAGACIGGGLRNCDDGVDCSLDGCDEARDACTHTAADGCVVGGTCVAAGALDPNNACKVCDPQTNLEGWSTVPTEPCLGLEDPDRDGFVTNLECPSGIASCPDTDEDGTPDYLDPDDDGDTVYTFHERGNGGLPQDTDQDGKADHLDPDDDGDGIPTRGEEPDPNADGDPGDGRDTDSDGKKDYLDPDDDGDGTSTSQERDDAEQFGTSDDEDQDGSPNWLDTDSDGDERSDHDEELGDGDLNDDDVPDYLQADVPGEGVDAGVDAGSGDAGGSGGAGGSGDAGGSGATGGQGGSGGRGGSGAEGGRDAPDGGVRDAGPEPQQDAGPDGGTSSSGNKPDSGNEPAADGGNTSGPIPGGLAGGSASRCAVTAAESRAPDLSAWILAMVGGLLVWRRRRV
jgi:MYXO-CTERM domain-containing protein